MKTTNQNLFGTTETDNVIKRWYWLRLLTTDWWLWNRWLTEKNDSLMIQHNQIKFRHNWHVIKRNQYDEWRYATYDTEYLMFIYRIWCWFNIAVGCLPETNILSINFEMLLLWYDMNSDFMSSNAVQSHNAPTIYCFRRAYNAAVIKLWHPLAVFTLYSIVKNRK